MYRVLLVDDEVLVREAISTNIKWNDLGFELAGSCQDGKEAIEFLEKNSVDVVLTDICMPHVDGMELSKFIYNHFNETSIIIFSGFEDFEYAQKAIKYNVKEYLLKPITAFELSEVLSTLKEDMDKKKEAEEKYGKLNETYNKNRLLIESKVLVDLITGSKTQTENDIALRDANITLSASHYRVAIIEIDDNSELYHHDEITKQQSSLMAFAVFNICDEIIKQKEAGMVCLGNDNRVFILFQSNKPEKFKSEIKDICYEISSNVKQYMKLSITIGIGCYVKYQKDIHKSYESAVDSMKYQYLLDENSIIDMEDIISNFNRDIELEDKIDTLILAIKMNIRDNIEQVFKQLEETMKKAYADKNICDLYLHSHSFQGPSLQCFGFCVYRYPGIPLRNEPPRKKSMEYHVPLQ
jgi:two-component system response regulator YesN